MLSFTSILKGATTFRKRNIAKLNRWKWYGSIEFLPIRNFYTIVETGDLRYLLKGIDYENLPTINIDLSKVWETIWNQFIEVSNDQDYKLYFTTLKRYSILNNRYEMLRSEVFTLYFRYSKEYSDDLLAEGIEINMESREMYLESLDKAANRIKSQETKIKLLEMELEARTKNAVKSEYLDIVNQVEQSRGIPIDIDKMSIKQFVLLINKLKENGKRAN